MTTSPIATRHPAQARFATEDAAGGQQTLAGMRAAWPVTISRSTAGTTNDSVTWDSECAVVLEMTLAISNGVSALGGGSVKVEVDVSGQSTYGGSDGWVAVTPSLTWMTGDPPIRITNALGKANILTRAGSANPRIRITTTGSDDVELVAFVAPIVANPSCA